MPKTPPDNSKRATFLRRSASTLGLWVVVAAAFASRQAWAYLGLIGVLTIISTLEYFRMLKAGGVKCFPRYGMLLAVAYSGVLYWMLLAGGSLYASSPGIEMAAGTAIRLQVLGEWFDGAAIFAAIAGAFFLQLRYPIRGLEALQAVAVNLLGFVYLAFLFNFAARLIFLVPGLGQVPGAMVLL